jgi:UDP-N-acetylglucosamine 2-epimerase
MTCHRRENVHIERSFQPLLDLAGAAPYPVYFPASYRTQKVIRGLGVTISNNARLVDPIGYEEMRCLMVNSRGVITDSGTVVEETCVQAGGPAWSEVAAHPRRRQVVRAYCDWSSPSDSRRRLQRHKPSHYHVPIERSLRGDGL